MGMFDTVMVPCPECGEKHEFQSKSGECTLKKVDLENCPSDMLADVNRHSPCACSCGIIFVVDLDSRASIKVSEVESKCVAGCKVYTGGEIRHHGDCVFYPESLTKKYDELAKENEKLRNGCKVVVDGYESDGMENMGTRDEVFYEQCKKALGESKQVKRTEWSK